MRAARRAPALPPSPPAAALCRPRSAARLPRRGRDARPAAARVIAALGLAVGLAAGCAAGSPPAPSPRGPAVDVDAIFAKWDARDSPGCAVAAIQDGAVVYSRGYGMADLDHDIAIAAAPVFHAASLAKQFTAMAVLLLAADGALSLDDDARRHLPELPDLGARITIRQLLHHTSGLRDHLVLLPMAGWRLSDDVVKEEDVLELVRRMRALNFAPGTDFLYSNTGYALAAVIVERVSGQSFPEFTRARIFAPLGMARTRFRETHGEIVKGQANGYRQLGGGPFELRMPNYDVVGPTNLLTTVEDLARWEGNFLHAKVGGPALVRQLQTAGALSDGSPIPYAFGLFVGRTYRGRPVVEHDGRDAGYRSHLLRFPEQRFAVACLCNLALPDTELPGSLARRVADVYLGAQPAPPTPSPAGPAPSEPEPAPRDLAPFEGRYYSEEIDAFYRVRVAAGGLSLERQKYPATPLRPGAAADAFRFEAGQLGLLGPGTLTFTRDAQGRVDGFLLSGQRVLRFRFGRVDAALP